MGNKTLFWPDNAREVHLRLRTDAVIDSIRQDVAANGKTERTFTLQWVDATGVVYAEIERLCYVADKQDYEQRKGDRQQSRFHR